MKLALKMLNFTYYTQTKYWGSKVRVIISAWEKIPAYGLYLSKDL